MERFRPLVRVGWVSLPLLTGACASGNGLGLEASDPSCVLLCALTRSLNGDSPKPQPMPDKTAVAPAVHGVHAHRTSNRTVLKRPHRAAGAASRTSRLIHARGPVPAPVPEAAAPQPVTAVPQTPAPAPVPAQPKAVSVIPGSAAIMPSTIQGR